MFNVNKFGIASTLALALCGTANATSVTYDYVGKNFDLFTTFDSGSFPQTNNTSSTLIGRRLTGSATFDDGIDNPVTSYIISDGTNTIDSTISNKKFGTFQTTFINDKVNTWFISLREFEFLDTELDPFGSNYIAKYLLSTNTEETFAGVSDQAFYEQRIDNRQYAIYEVGENDSPGTWTLRDEQVSAVPVPAALPLMASALGLFGFIKRRKQSV